MTTVIHLSDKNAKLQKTGKKNNVKVIGFDLPAGATCPCALECRAWCYAKKGNYRFPSKADASTDNLDASKDDTFVQSMTALLLKKARNIRKPLYVRMHASGDFYSIAYAKKWLAIATNCPNVTFYAYTKSVKIVSSIEWPKNVHIAYSLGGTQDLFIPEGAKIARVFKTREEAIAEGFNVEINDNDLVLCTDETKLGLVMH